LFTKITLRTDDNLRVKHEILFLFAESDRDCHLVSLRDLDHLLGTWPGGNLFGELKCIRRAVAMDLQFRKQNQISPGVNGFLCPCFDRFDDARDVA